MTGKPTQVFDFINEVESELCIKMNISPTEFRMNVLDIDWWHVFLKFVLMDDLTNGVILQISLKPLEDLQYYSNDTFSDLNVTKEQVAEFLQIWNKIVLEYGTNGSIHVKFSW